MSARSRARKNKRRNIVVVWDLMTARQNHIWNTFAKKAHKLTGLFPVMINPRANGCIYNMRVMLKALGHGPIPLRGIDGKAMNGVIAHPAKVNEEGITVELSTPPYIEFMNQHPPIIEPSEWSSDEWLREMLSSQADCFSIRATCDEDKKPKDILGWNLVKFDTATIMEQHAKGMMEQAMVTPELLSVDPSMFGRKHDEFGGLCAPIPEVEKENMRAWAKGHYSSLPFQHVSVDLPKEEPQRYASLISPQRQLESKTPQGIIDVLYGNDPRELVEATISFQAKSLGGQVHAFAKQILKNIDSIEGECEEIQPQTATTLLQARILREKEEERTLKDITQLQSMLGADKPFDDFYLKAPIGVYELFEHYVTVLPDGAWLPKPELRNAPIDQLKTPHKSGPFMLAVVSANEHEECRVNLENYGYVKIETSHRQIQFVPGEPESILVKRYFLIVLEGRLKPNDPHGFRIDSRPSIVDLLRRTSYE